MWWLAMGWVGLGSTEVGLLNALHLVFHKITMPSSSAVRPWSKFLIFSLFFSFSSATL